MSIYKPKDVHVAYLRMTTYPDWYQSLWIYPLA
jgi:hypothetical protein